MSWNFDQHGPLSQLASCPLVKLRSSTNTPLQLASGWNSNVKTTKKVTALASWNGIVAGCNGKVNGNFDSTGNGSRTLKPDVNFTFQNSKCWIHERQKILWIFLGINWNVDRFINDNKRQIVSLSFSNVKLSNDDDDWAVQELVWRGIEGQGMLISDIGSRPRKKWRSGTELWCRRRTPDWPRNSYSHAAMDKQKYMWIKNKGKAYLVFILSAMLLFSLGYWDSK